MYSSPSPRGNSTDSRLKSRILKDEPAQFRTSFDSTEIELVATLLVRSLSSESPAGVHCATNSAVWEPAPVDNSLVQYSDSPALSTIISEFAETPSKVYAKLPLTCTPPRFVTVTPQVTLSPAWTTGLEGKAVESTNTSGDSKIIRFDEILSLVVSS